MSARNSGLSAWRSALRDSSDSWLTRFLTSCRMKAKRRLNSSNRCALASASWLVRLGQRARGLAAGGAQQVEILPVERRGGIRARRARRCRPAARGGSAECRPTRRLSSSSHWGTGKRRSCALAQALRSASNSRTRPLLSSSVQKSASCVERVGAGCRRASSTRPRSRRPPPPSRHQQQPAGRVDDVGEGLDDALAERRRVRARRGRASR